MSTQPKGTPSESNAFARESEAKRASFFSDYLYFLKNNKKWWMLPLLLILLGFGTLMILSASGAAPFIYTLF